MESIGKKSYNAFISKSCLADLSKKNCLNKDFLDKLSQLVSKTKNS